MCNYRISSRTPDDAEPAFSQISVWSFSNARGRVMFTYRGKMCEPNLDALCTRLAKIPNSSVGLTTVLILSPFQDNLLILWRNYGRLQSLRSFQLLDMNTMRVEFGQFKSLLN